MFFFKKDNKVENAWHQERVIMELKMRISDLFQECLEDNEYEYLGEKRTFDENAIIESIEELIHSNIRIGEGDRTRLNEVLKEEPNLDIILVNERLTRKSNETRAKSKNRLDELFGGLFNLWKRKK